jgi:hypothetical protein
MKRLWVCSYCRNLELGTTLCPLFFNTSTVYTMPFLVTERHVAYLVLSYSLLMLFVFYYSIKTLREKLPCTLAEFSQTRHQSGQIQFAGRGDHYPAARSIGNR